MKKMLYTGVAAASLILSVALGPAASANSSSLLGDGTPTSPTFERSVETQPVTLEGCDAQVATSLSSASEDVVESVQEDICDGTQTITEDTFVVTAADAPKVADSLGLNGTEKKQFVLQAAAGAVKGATWTHSYLAVAVKEIHTGTTYWDGNKAWVASYRGLTGTHVCHAQGGWQFGATVQNISCNRPAASAKADSVDRFDIHMIAKGFPMVLNVGLHNAYTNTGVRSTWQVGG